MVLVVGNMRCSSFVEEIAGQNFVVVAATRQLMSPPNNLLEAAAAVSRVLVRVTCTWTSSYQERSYDLNSFLVSPPVQFLEMYVINNLIYLQYSPF